MAKVPDTHRAPTGQEHLIAGFLGGLIPTGNHLSFTHSKIMTMITSNDQKYDTRGVTHGRHKTYCEVLNFMVIA